MEKIKILLVDDETDFREVIGQRIRSWGYDFIEASSGKEGIGVLKKEKPDIIILDYMMPEMDGVTALGEIRKIDRTIPVIMFTAYPDAKSFDKTAKLKADSYIPKLSVYSDTQANLKEALELLAKKLKK